MTSILKRTLDAVSSLRLTLLCLAAALVLIFAGTLAQVRFGLFYVQEQYFESWLVWWVPATSAFRLPVFPGGHLIGAALLSNLVAAHLRTFVWSWRKVGIQLIHFGLILMLGGGLATDLFSVSSYMRLRKGETRNYSEDDMRMELAVTDLGQSDVEQVTAIPGEWLAEGGTIHHESMPFGIRIRGYYQNSGLSMIGRDPSASTPASTQGAGARLSVKSLPRATRMDERDSMSAVIEILPKSGHSLGTWLVSSAIGSPQEFEAEGRRWGILLRPTRYYKPYSLTLENFTHEKYPGTEIPKDFSSKVTLFDPEEKESRQVLIYMNHPLRYHGETYYQSGFEPDDSGTVLQVVRNPGAPTPYVACVVIGIGLIYQFSLHLTRFARRTRSLDQP